MRRTSTFLSATQRQWPVLSRLSLIARTTPPAWAISSAQNLYGRLSPTERARCRADLPKRLADLSGLRRQWWGTLMLATLLTIAVIARAFELPFYPQRMVIFAVTLYAILLPALLMHIGITYDYMAASALLQALRSTAADSLARQMSACPAPGEPFAIGAAPGAQLQPEYVEQEVEQPKPLKD